MSTNKNEAIETAVSKAIDLVREFSERNPHDGDVENPWKNPESMLKQLDLARQEIVHASQTNDEASAKNPDEETSDLRAAYMDLVTNAFADVLDDMRNNHAEEELNVDILVDCLQSGMDFLSGEEQEFLLMEDDDLDAEGPTPHEQRQVQLGLHVH